MKKTPFMKMFDEFIKICKISPSLDTIDVGDSDHQDIVETPTLEDNKKESKII